MKGSKMKKVIASVALVLALAGCSNGYSFRTASNGECIKHTKDMVFGLPYWQWDHSCVGGNDDSETTKRYRTMIDSCNKINDEQARSQCLQHVPPKP